MNKELAGWPHPESYSQQLNVQVETCNEWCPSRVCTGTSTVYFEQPGAVEGVPADSRGVGLADL